MKKIAVLILALFFAGFSCISYAAPSSNADKGHGSENKGQHAGKQGGGSKASGQNKHSNADETQELVHAAISALTARDIATRGGWTGYQPLPPGIAKNLSRGKPLPPGIAKKALPGGMLKKLPSHPGYEWYAAGKDLILVSIADKIIADVLRDVFE